MININQKAGGGVVTYGAYSIQNGLVLNLDAANPNSYTPGATAWLDLSGRGNNYYTADTYGASRSAPTLITTGGLTYFSFNDTATISDNLSSPQFFYRIVSNTDDIGGLAIYTQVTMDYWCNVTYLAADTYHPLYEKGWGDQIEFLANQANLPKVNIVATSSHVVSGLSTLSQSTWYNLCYTYDFNSLLLYINGSYVNGISYSGTAASYPNNRSSIGANSQGMTLDPNLTYRKYLHGYIGQIKFYNRALSAAEVLQNYKSSKSRYGK